MAAERSGRRAYAAVRKAAADELKSATLGDCMILERNPDAGDAWTFTALDADSKLIVSWLVGPRDADTASRFMQDIASRMANPPDSVTTDQLSVYVRAVESAFYIGDVDYAQLQKIYAGGMDGRYSPPDCIGCKKVVVEGDPSPRHISTSYVERSDLSMRMHMRRFTRLTNAFSRKLENHAAMLSLYFMFTISPASIRPCA